MRVQYAVVLCFLSAISVPSWGVPVRNLALPTPRAEKAAIEGEVCWDGGNLAGTTLYVYKDAALTQLVGGTPLLSKAGTFRVNVAPGSYYLVAVVDRNGNAAFDNGDAMGVYGILKWGDTKDAKRAVTVGDKQKATNVKLYISAVRKTQNGRPVLLPMDAEEAAKSTAESSPAETVPTTGTIRGQVRLPENKAAYAPVYVFAYADLSWRRRIGQDQTDDKGNYELTLPPGKYFLTAVLDQDFSNVLDPGDAFGVYGKSPEGEENTFQRVPLPVTVEAGKSLEAVNIDITARQNDAGRFVALDAGTLPTKPSSGEVVELRGRVVWDGKTLGKTSVELYDNPALLNSIAETVADSNGNFSFTIPKGNYFLLASVDADNNNRYSDGDGLGGYGTYDIASSPPVRFSAFKDAPEAVIRISAAFNAAGQLVSQETAGTTTEVETGLRGQLSWDGHVPPGAWLLLSKTADFAEPAIVPVELDKSGSFLLPASAGVYYLMAIVDSTEDGRMGVGDGVAIYGTRTPLTGHPSPITVVDGRVTPFIHLWVSSIITDGQGGYSPLDDGNRAAIRRKYGEPNESFRRTDNGRLLEEWWYWNAGIAFTFAAEGPVWTLVNTYEFQPNREMLEAMRPNDLNLGTALAAQSTVNGVVYYTSDDVLWAIAPNGSQEPIGVGTAPQATKAGLLFRDESGQMLLLRGDGKPTQAPLRPELTYHELALSPDGSTFALTRLVDGQTHLSFYHLPSKETLTTPIKMVGVEGLSWSPGGTTVAFAAAENDSSRSRDIYAYDGKGNHLEPLITGATNDSEPAWSPTDSHSLAFTREDGGMTQLWVTTFSDAGAKTFQQATRFGGRHPAWLPDGKGLVYESNGQLWTVDLETGTERPLLVNGEPVPGSQPAVAALKP